MSAGELERICNLLAYRFAIVSSHLPEMVRPSFLSTLLDFEFVDHAAVEVQQPTPSSLSVPLVEMTSLRLEEAKVRNKIGAWA